jgi:hypothetical protein
MFATIERHCRIQPPALTLCIVTPIIPDYRDHSVTVYSNRWICYVSA